MTLLSTKVTAIKKTDYISITNSNNKIILNSLEFNMRAGDEIIYG